MNFLQYYAYFSYSAAILLYIMLFCWMFYVLYVFLMNAFLLNAFCRTVFHYACHNGHFDIAKLLIKNKVCSNFHWIYYQGSSVQKWQRNVEGLNSWTQSQKEQFFNIIKTIWNQKIWIRLRKTGLFFIMHVIMGI